MNIPVYQFNADFNPFLILDTLSDIFGLVFLQDVEQPFFAFYPKQLHVLDQHQLFIRNKDFTYTEQQQLQPQKMTFTPNSATHDLSFSGGYITFISYDYAAQQFIQQKYTNPSPTALIGEYDIFIKKVNNFWTLHIAENLNQHPFIQQLITRLEQTGKNSTSSFKLKHGMQARWTKTDYAQAFQKVQDYLHAGDCYQINLTQEFFSKIKSGRLIFLLPELLQLSQAPFAGYIRFSDFELLSCSPELFIEFQQDRILKTRPIKGTLPRHQDENIDALLKQKLAKSDKDQAENLMIVDLLRNDLSIYAEIGSVKVPSLFEIESFAQVHHMVSEIQATLKADINVFEVLLAALPGGSITGAPKIRAMQIIDELENNCRGAYCGTLGYMNYDGTGRFNILIRSLQRYHDHLSIWAGGGITVASDMQAEYQECLDKVSALLNVLDQYADTTTT